MTGGRVDATTDTAIGVTEVVTEEATGEVTGEATVDAGVLSATDMVLTAGIIAVTRRCAARSLFPKC